MNFKQALGLALLGMAMNCPAETDSFFQSGLEAFRTGQFEKSARDFQESLAKNPASGTLLNLGFAQWRRGRAGEAIVAWEQAAWMNPFDKDARKNLEFARQAAQVDPPELRWYEAASTWLPTNFWVWIAGVSLWLAVAMITLPGVFRARKAGWHQTLAALAFGVFLLGLPPCLGVITRARIAIVLDKNVALRLTPTREGEVISSLTAGEAVRTKRARGNYYFIRTQHGAGWIEQKQIGLLCPATK